MPTGAVEVIELCNPHLVLAHFGADDGVTASDLAQGAHDLLGLYVAALVVPGQGLLCTPVPQSLAPALVLSFPVRLGVLGFGKLKHALQGKPAVGNNRHVHLHVLANGGGVDVDVHDLGLGSKGGELAGYAIVEASANADDEVSVVEGHVRCVGAVHAHHAKPQIGMAGEAAKTHEGTGHWAADLIGKLRELLGCVGEDDAAACEDDGTCALLQNLHGLAQLVVVRPVVRVVGAHGYILVAPRELGLAHLNVLGQIDEHGAGTACARDVEGFADDPAQLGHVLHKVVVLCAGTGDAHGVHFLEGVVADEACANLTADNH